MRTLDQISACINPVFRQYPVRKAMIFGSVAKGIATPESDVDIVVEFSEVISLLSFVGLRLALEDALNIKVDLVELQTIKPQLKSQILAEQVTIYG
jgi:uncharacterized protein